MHAILMPYASDYFWIACLDDVAFRRYRSWPSLDDATGLEGRSTAADEARHLHCRAWCRVRRVLFRIRPGRKRGCELGPMDRPVSASGWKTFQSGGQDCETHRSRLVHHDGGCRGRVHGNGRPHGSTGRRDAGISIAGRDRRRTARIDFLQVYRSCEDAGGQSGRVRQNDCIARPSAIIKAKQYVSDHTGTD